jgi:hypothetical protein
VEDVITFLAVITCDNIGRCVSLDMTYMEAVAARVGEHIEHVILPGVGAEVGISGIGGSEGSGL